MRQSRSPAGLVILGVCTMVKSNTFTRAGGRRGRGDSLPCRPGSEYLLTLLGASQAICLLDVPCSFVIHTASTLCSAACRIMECYGPGLERTPHVGCYSVCMTSTLLAYDALKQQSC